MSSPAVTFRFGAFLIARASDRCPLGRAEEFPRHRVAFPRRGCHPKFPRAEGEAVRRAVADSDRLGGNGHDHRAAVRRVDLHLCVFFCAGERERE